MVSPGNLLSSTGLASHGITGNLGGLAGAVLHTHTHIFSDICGNLLGDHLF